MNKIQWGFLALLFGLIGWLLLYVVGSFPLFPLPLDSSTFVFIWYSLIVLFSISLIIGILTVSGWQGLGMGILFMIIAYLLGAFSPLRDWALWILVIPLVYVILKGKNRLNLST